MSRIKLYRGLNHKRLAALVRRSQHPKVPVEVVLSFGPVTEDVSVANYNSKVLVTATDHNGKLTDKEVLYRRLNLEKLKDLPAGELVPYADIQFPTTTHTIPGKNVAFMEYDYKWHGIPPNADQAKEALKALRTMGGKIRGEHE
jgi:hypothetical protein